MLLYKKLLLMTFGTALILALWGIKPVPCGRAVYDVGLHSIAVISRSNPVCCVCCVLCR